MRIEGEKIAEGLAAAALVGAPLALGMVHLPAILGISALGWASFVVLVFTERRERLRLGWFAWALLAFALLPLFQLVPLPAGLIGAIAPETARVLRTSLGADHGLRPLTLDVGATWTAVVKAMGMAAVAVVFHRLAQTDRHARRRLRLYVIAASASVILLGLGHFLVGERQNFLGLYTFRAAHHFRTSFGNANHLAGFLSLGGLLALGMAAHKEGWKRRAPYLVVFLGAALGVFLSASRGGFVAFVAGLFLFGILAWSVRTHDAAPWKHGLTLGLATVLAAGVATWVYVEFPRALREIQTLFALSPESEAGKVEAAQTAWAAAKAHWLTGIGRGAFESAGTLHQPRPFPRIWFTHAENEVLQALAEFGIPLGGALVLAFVLAWLGVARQGQRSLAEAGVAAGLFALALQNLVDFSLQGAAGLSFAALLAHPSLRPLSAPSWVGRALAAAGVLVVVAGGIVAWPGLEEENRRLAEFRPPDADTLAAEVMRALARRPADWVAVDRMATHLLYVEDDPAAALSWINRAILLYPQNGRAHALAGEALARLGRHRQARWAFQAAEARGVSTVDLVLDWYQEPEELLQAIPADPQRAAHAAERLLRRGEVEVAREALQRALAHHPDDPDLLRVLYAVQARRGAHEEALAIARTLRAREPDRHANWGREARALAQVGAHDEARALYEEAVRRFDAHPSLVFGWANMELSLRRPEAALAALDRLPPSAHRETRLRFHELRARAYRQKNELLRARDELRNAVRLAPDAPGMRIALADVLSELGEFSAASAQLEGLDADAPAVQAAQRRVEERRRKYQEERGLDLERLLR